MNGTMAAAVTDGQGWEQLGELLLAFALSSTIGLERQFRDKSAGLRTQSIVGTASALFLLISKYGFGDGASVDQSRVAAQVVSGIGFLGAGLIITRRGAIRGLTTAAAVWETAAIGMAAGAGLPVLAVAVTVLHFVAVFAYTPLGRLISRRAHAERSYTITYHDGRGVLRELLAACTAQGWTVNSLVITGQRGSPEVPTADPALVAVALTLTGPGAATAGGVLGAVPGVSRIDAGADDDD
jgi:putative Mg2+ transporter-C (MgtC) family protein